MDIYCNIKCFTIDFILYTILYYNTARERIEVFYSIENVLSTELQFFANSNIKIDSCMNYTRPQLAIVLGSIRNSFIDARNRGIKLRYLTEITSENISYCKELLHIVNELRHLDGIKGNFMISETEYLAPVILFEEGKVASQLIHSNAKELVEQHEYIFDTLWSNAISAERRIIEIEEGAESVQTKVLEDKEKIFKHIKSVIEKSSERSVCSSIGAMQLVYNNFFEEYKKLIYKHRTDRNSRGIRWITSIEKDSIDLVKIFMDAGIPVRHVKNLTPINFAVDNKHFYATIESMQEGRMIESLLVSNEPAYVKHFNIIFEQLWSKGIDAKVRISDIENGIEIANVEIIENPKESIDRAYDISISAKEELLVAFPTVNAFRRNMHAGMSMQLLKQQHIKDNDIKIRILTPINKEIIHTIEELKVIVPQVEIRAINESMENRITIVLADRKECLIIEIRDDTRDNMYEAAGLSIYSNSNSIVWSYVSIFERLWKLSELYAQIKESHEQLKVHDRMQKEFINIAAHELRTPVQPILGLSDVLLSKKGNIEEHRELLEAINRNSKRLQALIDRILDITRIESQSLKLKKEKIDLNEVILRVISDYKNQIKKEAINVNLSFIPKGEAIVEADRLRLSQVFDTILSNAIKFTKTRVDDNDKNDITITVQTNKNDEKKGGQVNYEAIVSIKDTGTGIDPEIFPRLFAKFATKSDKGTGLGLFISKSIVEAHGGRIWAENYGSDRQKGAVFYFTIPSNK
jgi:signal transduction histidine kinase